MAKQENTLRLSDVERQVGAQAAMLDWQTSLQQACYDAITCDDVKDIVRTQVSKAKEGDANAIKFIFGHVLGGNRTVTITNNQVIGVEDAAREQQKRMRDR